MGISRADVYICNVIKCRPPDNRNPEPDEVAACEPFLFRQIDLVRPRAIVGLGTFAVQAVLKVKIPISKLRGNWQEFRGIRLMPTFHPAYLLRTPGDKRLVWADIQEVMKYLGMPIPRAAARVRETRGAIDSFAVASRLYGVSRSAGSPVRLPTTTAPQAARLRRPPRFMRRQASRPPWVEPDQRLTARSIPRSPRLSTMRSLRATRRRRERAGDRARHAGRPARAPRNGSSSDLSPRRCR